MSPPRESRKDTGTAASRSSRAEGWGQGAALFAREQRWGTTAPSMLRLAALVAWAALATRLAAVSLPGSRTGIEVLIRRADTASSIFSWAAALIGSSQLVLLLVHTLSERTLGYLYRLLVIAPAGAVLFLVMLSSTMPLDPEQSLALGGACLILAFAGAGASLGSRVGRAHGLVLLAVTLGAAARLGARTLELGMPGAEASWASRIGWLAAAGRVLDTLAVSLAAVRFVAERRRVALGVTLAALGAAAVLAWGGIRGSFDGASLWQVLASRALGDLSGTAAGGLRQGYAVDAFALLFGGIVACFPGQLSLGLLSATFAILARQSVDVPACALVLAQGALMGALCHTGTLEPRIRVPSSGQGEAVARGSASEGMRSAS